MVGKESPQAGEPVESAAIQLPETSNDGADAGRVQAVGKGADRTKHGIELNFSDAQGQFPSTSTAAANH